MEWNDDDRDDADGVAGDPAEKSIDELDAEVHSLGYENWEDYQHAQAEQDDVDRDLRAANGWKN